MNNKDRDFLCWLAGFYEGEGSCGFYPEMNHGNGVLTLSISQKEKFPLEEIKNFFKYGSVSVCRHKDRENCHSFYIGGNQVVLFLEVLLPFMRTEKKINQAINALLSYFKKPLKDRKKYTNKSVISLLRKRDNAGKFIRS